MKELDARPLFIFEMANNHGGSLEHGLRILRDVRAAAEPFAERFQLAFKLQYRHLDTFLHPAWRDRDDIKYVKRFRETRLQEPEFRALVDEARKLGYLLVCTPFDERSVDLIEQHGFDVLKVASCSFTDWPLLERMAASDKPVIASTAGAALEDIDKVVSFFLHRKKALALMHCVAEYPTKPEHLEMNQLDLLRARYPQVRVGFSTHEPPESTAPVQLAVAKGASIFERHVSVPSDTIPMNNYSATPAQVASWLTAAAEAYSMCGVTGRRPAFGQAELDSLRSLRRGIFVAHDIRAGQKLRPADFFFAIPTQPGQLTANDLSKYVEFQAQADIPAQGPLLENQVSRVDRREKIYAIVQRVKKLIRDAGVVVPGQAEFSISHQYGVDRFEEYGATIIDFINREYCKKLIVVLPGQVHIDHLHKRKEETFLVVYGDISIELNGESRECKPGDLVVVERGVMHNFRSRGGAVMEELSSTHYKDDSYYSDPNIGPAGERKTIITHWLEPDGATHC